MVSLLMYHVVVRLANTCDESIRIGYDMFMRLCIAKTKDGLQGDQLNWLVRHFQRWSSAFD